MSPKNVWAILAGGVLSVAASCGKSSPRDANTASTIGPEGGRLSSAGVSVDIPPGALDASVALTLTVSHDDNGIVIDVEPGVDFAVPATVSLDKANWIIGTPGLALREFGDDWYSTGDLIPNGDQTTYQTLGFSRQRSIVTVDGDPCSPNWALYQVYPGHGKVEAQVTGQRLEATRRQVQDRPSDYLVNVNTDAAYGFQFADTVNDPRPTCPRKQPRDPAERFQMSREAADTLKKAREVLQSRFRGYDININGAFDSSGCVHANANDFHTYGAALDLALCKPTGAGECTKTPGDYAKLGEILVEAGFDFVHFETAGHFHVGRTSPSVGVMPFPGATAGGQHLCADAGAGGGDAGGDADGGPASWPCERAGPCPAGYTCCGTQCVIAANGICCSQTIGTSVHGYFCGQPSKCLIGTCNGQQQAFCGGAICVEGGMTLICNANVTTCSSATCGQNSCPQ